MRRGIGGLLVALCAIGMGACSDSTAPKEDARGTYNLTTVASMPVPVVLYQDSSETDELSSGYLTLGESSQWNGILVVRTTTGTNVVADTAFGSGSYSVSGSDLTLTERDGSQLKGTVGGGTLTLIEGDGQGGTVALVFKK